MFSLLNALLAGYRQVHADLQTVRGRIDLAEQLRRRPGVDLPLAVTYAEHDEDVIENRLLFAAALTLRGLGATHHQFTTADASRLHLDAGERVRLKPDLPYWLTGQRCTFIGDVKYKRDTGTGHREDVYQLLAYATAVQLARGDPHRRRGPADRHPNPLDTRRQHGPPHPPPRPRPTPGRTARAGRALGCPHGHACGRQSSSVTERMRTLPSSHDLERTCGARDGSLWPDGPPRENRNQESDGARSGLGARTSAPSSTDIEPGGRAGDPGRQGLDAVGENTEQGRIGFVRLDVDGTVVAGERTGGERGDKQVSGTGSGIVHDQTAAELADQPGGKTQASGRSGSFSSHGTCSMVRRDSGVSSTSYSSRALRWGQPGVGRGRVTAGGEVGDGGASAGTPVQDSQRRATQKSLILRWLEESLGSKEPVDLTGLTMEHVLPQTATPAWRAAIAEDLQDNGSAAGSFPQVYGHRYVLPTSCHRIVVWVVTTSFPGIRTRTRWCRSMIGDVVFADGQRRRGFHPVDIEVQKLASDAAAMIVRAVASDVWPTVKRGISRLLTVAGFGGPEADERLDTTGTIAADYEGAVPQLTEEWRSVLYDALLRFPALVDELNALMVEVSPQVTTGTTNRVQQEVSVSGHGEAVVSGVGDATVHRGRGSPA